MRGLHKNRFAGDALLYGNLELRLALATVSMVVPAELGLFGAADVGRVFHAADPRRRRRLAQRKRGRGCGCPSWTTVPR